MLAGILKVLVHARTHTHLPVYIWARAGQCRSPIAVQLWAAASSAEGPPACGYQVRVWQG